MDWTRALLASALAAILVAPAAAWTTACGSHVCVLPSPPMGLVAQAKPDGIHLSWLESAAGPVDRYVVRRMDAGGNEESFDAGQDTRYVDQPAVRGPFTYFVVAVHEDAISLPSNPAPVLAWPYCSPADILPAEVREDCVLPAPLLGQAVQ